MLNRLKNILPPTRNRVERNTARRVTDKLKRRTKQNIIRYATASPEAIDRRIMELEREWDTERALEAGGALHIFLGLALGTFVNRRWYAWSGVVATFLLQHALLGWCPPIAVLRRRGFRTSAEIGEEIEALRILRGDFHPTDDPQDAMTQVESAHHEHGGPIIPKPRTGM
ncbi:YgaP family membrane protein [Verrucomicrobiota bacterium sgz303538]